ITEFGQPLSTYKAYSSFPRIHLSAETARRKTKTLTLSIANTLSVSATEMGIPKLSNDRLTERFALKNSQTSYILRESITALKHDLT
ncbi:hypothetical protein X801_04092, partial [Opisthorchis viverrini]